MKNKYLPQEEKWKAKELAEDSSWEEQDDYNWDPEYLACVEDIIQSKVFQSMDHYMQHGDTTCKAHCLQVSYLSYRICRKLGWEYKEAARAGLLHDLFLYDWHTHAKETGEHFHGFTHPRTALNNAVIFFDLTENEKNMILRHMWPLTPVPPKTRAGMVIVYADKHCGLVETAARFKRWVLYGRSSKSTA